MFYHATTLHPQRSAFGLKQKGDKVEFTTATGETLTDDLLDEMAKEYENGTWEGHGEVVLGPPPLFTENDAANPCSHKGGAS